MRVKILEGKLKAGINSNSIRLAEESEVFYRHLTLLTPEAIVVHRDGKIIYCNPAAVRYIKATKTSQLIGKPIMQFVHPLSQEIIKERVGKMISLNKGVPTIEEQFIALDGTIRTAEVKAIPFDYQGKPAILAILHDITEQKKMQEELLKSEERYKAIFNQTTVALSIADSQGKWISFNPAYPKMFGYSPNELAKISPLQLFFPEDIKKYTQQFNKLIEGKVNHLTAERRYLHKNGACIYGFLQASAVRDKKGKLKYVVVAIQDITKRKKAEEALKYEQQITSLSQKAGKVGTFEWNLLTGYSNGTKEFEALYGRKKGYSGGDLLQWSEFIHPDDKKRVISYTQKSIQKSRNFQTEFRVIWPNKSLHYLQTRAIIQRDKDGKAVLMRGVTMDITEQKKLEQQKDDFLGIASHELKTPLTSLKAYGQVLLRRFKDKGDEKSASMLTKMDDQIDKLTDLISDLLDISKLESGGMRYQNEEFQFDSLVEEITEEVGRTSDKHRLIIQGRTGKTIAADRERIGQVITNYLSNAIKYSPMSEKIVVILSSDTDSITLCVEDNGIGIPKDQLSHIFKRFYRVSGRERETIPGMGLGLYISSQIIKRQGGKVWVESQEGKGSRFYFSLPIKSG